MDAELQKIYERGFRTSEPTIRGRDFWRVVFMYGMGVDFLVTLFSGSQDLLQPFLDPIAPFNPLIVSTITVGALFWGVSEAVLWVQGKLMFTKADRRLAVIRSPRQT